jgi:hypothetical protein
MSSVFRGEVDFFRYFFTKSDKIRKKSENYLQGASGGGKGVLFCARAVDFIHFHML